MTPEYAGPGTDCLTEDHVFAALDFLVAVEPDPPSESWAEYRAALLPFEAQIELALATLRRFAEQTRPLTLEAMRYSYYGFTNHPRYLVSAEVSGVVTGSLNKAWDGVGPWRR